MVRYDAVVVHYGELWLKGRNRSTFIERLKDNIRVALKGCGAKMVDDRDRLTLYFKDQKLLNKALERLQYVSGISWFGPVMIAKNAIASIINSSNKMLGSKDIVRIAAKRSYKGVKFDSYQIVSEFIKKSEGLKFKIDKDAKTELLVTVTSNGTVLCSKKIDGIGGLPSGSSGKAVVLLSGGIDSPVAAVYAMKRGLEVFYLHMHAFNNNKEASSSKMADLLGVLSKYGPGQKVYYAPAYVFQSATMKIPRKYELVLFRRFLYRLAEEVAKKEHATAIVTGESLGQVASQTIGNMTSSQDGIEQLIIRPLIGFDKREIIEQAKKIGTFEISIKPYKDVCSIGIKNPSTNMNSKLVTKLYNSCKLDAALERTLKTTLGM
jgi:thiamine biosynthesis protein ThiI